MKVFIEDIVACGMCGTGARDYFLRKGWTKQQVIDFYKNGMELDQFESEFGHDAMAQPVIKRVKQNVE